jgi:ATP-dependent Clp protease ATP-binding subunit ClpA
VVLIMTTNAGAAEMAKSAMGFGRDEREGEDEEAIKRMFTPEFRNRLDATIGFASLSPEIVGRVVDKFIGELEGQLADQGVTIDLSEEARERLAVKGYDSQNGARPLARVIQEDVKKPLADELLFGRLAKGGRVTVGVSDGAFTFVFADGPPPKKKKRKTDEPGELEPVK